MDNADRRSWNATPDYDPEGGYVSADAYSSTRSASQSAPSGGRPKQRDSTLSADSYRLAAEAAVYKHELLRGALKELMDAAYAFLEPYGSYGNGR